MSNAAASSVRPPDHVLTAGPSAVSHRTLAAYGTPVTYQYDPYFVDVFRRTERMVAEIFRTAGDVVMMQGEAVLGLEAAAHATIAPGTECLALSSGLFGKGYGYWMKARGAVVHELEVPWNEALDPAAVEQALAEHPEVKVVSVVHSETPSGTLNPLAEIGPIIRRHGAISIVDCVSSVGGVPFDPDAWELDICVTGPHKCIAGPQGISLVAVSDRAWEAIRANPHAPRDSYMSLLDWKEKWLEQGQFPYIPAISEAYALQAACAALLEEGLEASYARHELIARACRAGVRALGLELWPADEEICSASVTVATLPGELTDVEVRDHIRNRYGVMLSDGEGATDRVVRVGHMGVSANPMTPALGVAAIGRGLADLGFALDVGAGVEAALEIVSDGTTAGAR
jgi:pyridoxamine--pyruvate transaminase